DSTGGEYSYAGPVRDPHSGSDRGGSVPAFGDSDGDVSYAELVNIVALGYPLKLLLREPDSDRSFDYCDGRWDRSRSADFCFETDRGLDVLRPRQAMCDDGRFERHHRLGICQRLLYLFTDFNEIRFDHLVAPEVS